MSKLAQRTHRTYVLLVLTTSILSCGLSMELFQVKLVEKDNSRLIATSNSNYALASPKLLAKGWQTVSVNGDQVFLTLASSGEQKITNRLDLGEADFMFVEALRDEIANSNSGYSHTSTYAGSGGSNFNGNFMMSSSRQGGSSSFSSSSSSQGQMSSSNLSSNGQMSYSMRDDDNFSVSRSDFPFNWSRVFFNGNTLTFVFKNGNVRMQPMSSLSPEELEAVTKVKNEVMQMKQSQAQHLSSTMQNSMDMVSNVFNNIMGNFPRPPDYRSSVGNMFGNNFPFGPNNSPFSPASGWPFGGGAGTGAFAFAGRR